MSIEPLLPSNRRQTVIATADIETSSTGELLDANLAWGDEYRTCSSWHEWLDCVVYAQAITRRYKGAGIDKIWFHNGGGFDVVALLRCIIDGEFGDRITNVRTMLSGGTIIQLSFNLDGCKRKINLADSYRLLPASLAELCGPKGFGLNDGKEPVPEEYKSRMEDWKREFPTEYHSYHKRDTLALLEILTLYRGLLNEIAPIGNLRLTCASTAMAVFRTRFLDRAIITPTDREIAFTRLCYQGGRTEYFGDGVPYGEHQRGYKGVNCYDINSAYPGSMERDEFPINRGIYTESSDYWKDGKGRVLPGCYRVKFKQCHGRVALLKSRELDGSLSKEAQWDGEAYITHLEANNILAGGGFVELIEGYVYEETAPIFREFIRTLYEMRLEYRAAGNNAMVLVIKLIMNNLYGKFAQRDVHESIEMLTVDQAADMADELDATKGEGIKPYPGLPGAWLVAKKVDEHQQGDPCFPAIAAMITAAVRIFLLSVPNEYGIPIIYADTDSVHTQHELPAAIIDDKRLGMFKLEKRERDMIYGGRKLYADRTGKKHRAKGVPSSAVVYELLIATLEGDGEYAVEYFSPSKVKTMLSRNVQRPNEFLEHVRRIKPFPSTRELNLLHQDWKP